MHFSKLLTVSAVAIFSATTHAFKASHEVALDIDLKQTSFGGELASKRHVEKRACHWGSCDECYGEEPICQVCNNPDPSDPSGGLAACIVCLGYCEDQCC